MMQEYASASSQKLGAETGLAIIKTLTELMDASQKDEIVISIFRDRVLPFYRIISHPDVLSSLILETAVDTMYTFLFGPSGRRGLQVFRFTATALSGMVLEHSLSDEEVFIVAISSSLAVLDRLVETNQSAQVIEGFTAIVETISACIPNNLMAPSAQLCLTRLRRRLNIGSSLPLAATQSTPQILLSPSFELAQDLPGNLSSQGARHDNDHASIGDIQILPTAQEIASPRQEYLPLTDSTQNHLSGLAGLLDKQFRLLREDTVGQLRDAVREEATRLEHPNGKVSKTHQGQQGVRKIIYHNVRFSRMSVDRRKGLQVVAEFDQPSQLNGKSIKQREEWWKGSKLLQVDSLVCFVSSDGKIISSASVIQHCRLVLFREGKLASVLLSMGEYKAEDAVWISTHISASENRQSLVEFPGVLLPSFKPTLQALQGMSLKLSLPFAEIVAPDLQDSAASVKPPAYATRRGFSFNLEVLADVPLTLKPGQPFDFAKLDAGSTLDRAQQLAVVQALSTGLALIQGPPGTGKSYTGVAIIKTLLHNREAADLGPIICVCYTNHALDQLLEHLVKDGVTTSGLARNIELLQRVRAKVMLCEEAGEVLEAHTLTALLPGIEHAILIGDHEQLRPQINSYELQHDSPRGKRYSLDISLFERLVRPQMGNFQVPLSTLKTQRRMHPSISELVRVPLYPDLQDHPLVSEYPQVDGMRDRLYWLDHQEREDPRPANAVSLSRTNIFEVDMIAALVSHLVRQGTYGSGDIAVITPYLGQLQKIKKRLSTSFEIVVGDRDQEDLEVHGLQDDPETSIDGQVQIQKTTLLNALRIATVDNFQGEEAKVIVISLVRSNDERKCGFLKTSNRINVLLSRARHGMFIIGNSDTSRPVPMWAKVLSILERSNNIGPKLALCCPRHRETSIEVSVPDDFARLALKAVVLRDVLRDYSSAASNAAQEQRKAVSMSVRDLAEIYANQDAKSFLFDIPLPCGHVARQLRCHEAQTPAVVRCQVQMEQVMEHCKHKIRVRCHELPLNFDYPCSAICGAALACGHNCIRYMKFARPSVEDHTQPAVIAANLHAMVKCPVLYVQSPVKSAAIIQNVASFVTSLVRHVLRIVLGLVHIKDGAYYRVQYPAICSHAHSAAQIFWLAGIDVPIKEMVVDFILSSTFEEVDLDENPCIVPSCGHILTLESMDGHMSMSDFYTMNGEGSIVDLKNSAEPFSASGMKSCPTCRGPLRNLNRYSRIVRRALIDEATKKFIVWANMEFIPLVTRMHAIEAELRETIGGSRKAAETASPLNPCSEPLQLKGTLDQQISLIGTHVQKESRYIKIIGLRREIKKFLQQVNEKEQPFGRIYDLVQDARRHRGVNINLQSKVDVLQVRSRILTTVLLIRCDYTILLTFLNDQKGRIGAFTPSTQVDFSINRKECEQLIEESDTRYQPGNYVEGLLYWARFFALERSFVEPGSELTQLFRRAIEYLQLAHEICDEYPGQTAGMKNEVEGVEKMLRDSTFYMPVSNEEKAAVYAAMAHDFRGTGHWYYCENGHPFTIGECGMPMETSQCPQCGSPVGGRNHQAISSVRPATDLELQFGGVRI
ncbi:hypothetical protein H4I96_12262 [Botrytis cinerea]